MTSDLRAHEHTLDGETFDACVIAPEGGAPRPGVLVFHGWEGRSELQEAFGRDLTGLGYAAFCVDLYGKGKRGTTPRECEALMTPFLADRAALRKRLLHVAETAAAQPEIDAARVAAVGFCFGGLCVLDLARAGAPVRAVGSFHGLFTPPGLPTLTPIAAKVAAFHGWDDPMVPPSDVVALAQELTEAGADWQLHAYGATMHAFMARGANAPEMGIQYNERSARRAWETMRDFLAEAFA